MKGRRNIPKAFISFLIASFLIWLLITFSKEYTTTISFPIAYKNIPQNRLLQKAPMDKLNIVVNGSGFKIVKTKIATPILYIDASYLSKFQKSKFYLLTKSQQAQVQNQLTTSLEIKRINSDTIFLDIGVLTSKKMKLVANTEISYHVGYDLLDDIVLKPDSIVVSGTEDQLKNLNDIQLNKLILKDVKSNFKQKVSIVKPHKLKNLKFNTLSVEISGKVDKFTEGKLKIPFIISNLPEGKNITTLSENVEVSYVVALSNFSKVTEASFKVECNYLSSQMNNLSYLIPKVISKPSFLKSYKVVPLKIDFIIQK